MPADDVAPDVVVTHRAAMWPVLIRNPICLGGTAAVAFR